MDFITPFITWLLNCDGIKNKKLFLNAVKAQDSNIGILTQQISENTVKKYIDGSKAYPITFTVNDYKAISFNPLTVSEPQKNKNVSDLLELNKIISYITEMNKKGNFPQFSDNIEVQKIYCQYSSPPTPTVDSSFSPPIAKYSLPIICEVLEYAD